MGGVDLCDQMLYYRMYFRSKKYYHRFIFHLIDLPVVNSWMLYRRDGEALKLKKQIPLYEFKFKLASSLMLAGKNVTRERGRPSIRVENAFRKKKSWKGNKKHSRKRCKDRWHWPLSSFLGKKAKCKLPGCNGKIQMNCIKCEVNLCCDTKRNCFLIFHTS